LCLIFFFLISNFLILFIISIGKERNLLLVAKAE